MGVMNLVTVMWPLHAALKAASFKYPNGQCDVCYNPAHYYFALCLTHGIHLGGSQQLRALVI